MGEFMRKKAFLIAGVVLALAFSYSAFAFDVNAITFRNTFYKMELYGQDMCYETTPMFTTRLSFDGLNQQNEVQSGLYASINVEKNGQEFKTLNVDLTNNPNQDIFICQQSDNCHATDDFHYEINFYNDSEHQHLLGSKSYDITNGVNLTITSLSWSVTNKKVTFSFSGLAGVHFHGNLFNMGTNSNGFCNMGDILETFDNPSINSPYTYTYTSDLGQTNIYKIDNEIDKDVSIDANTIIHYETHFRKYYQYHGVDISGVKYYNIFENIYYPQDTYYQHDNGYLIGAGQYNIYLQNLPSSNASYIDGNIYKNGEYFKSFSDNLGTHTDVWISVCNEANENCSIYDNYNITINFYDDATNKNLLNSTNYIIQANPNERVAITSYDLNTTSKQVTYEFSYPQEIGAQYQLVDRGTDRHDWNVLESNGLGNSQNPLQYTYSANLNNTHYYYFITQMDNSQWSDYDGGTQNFGTIARTQAYLIKYPICYNVQCNEYCNGTTLYTNGVCDNNTGECVYSQVTNAQQCQSNNEENNGAFEKTMTDLGNGTGNFLVKTAPAIIMFVVAFAFGGAITYAIKSSLTKTQ